MFESLQFFSTDYLVARTKFREAVAHAGGKLEHYPHPLASGTSGEKLTIDVGLLGSESAERCLVAISGTHGLEGFAGSALQTAWLSEEIEGRLPSGVAVLLVHGLNPFGFFYGSRTNAAGVDLNRNFVDHSGAHPRNHSYDVLHPYLVPREWTSETLRRAREHLSSYAAEHGEDALFDAISRGQYTHPDGVFYGGCQPEWENRILRQVLEDHLQACSKVAVIDWHTGIGTYGQPFFLVFNHEESEEFRQAGKWWGRTRVEGVRPHGRRVPGYQGLVVRGVESCLRGRSVVSAVIEFGTRGAEAGGIAIRQDQWLRLHGKDADPGIRAQLKADLLDSLNPVAYEWRDSVLEHGLEIMRAAVAGLGGW